MFSISLCGQETSYYTTRYTTQDGLPHNRIDAIGQDQSGFIWIGTWNGLSRFDGNEFKNYTHDPDDPASIPYFAIYSICFDRNNNLWVETPPGFPLGLYDRKNDCFITYSRKLTGQCHIQSEKFTICLDPSGTLWILGDGGIEKFNHSTRSFDPVKFDRHFPESPEKVIEFTDLRLIFDNENNFWLFNKHQLFMAERKGKNGGSVIRIVMEYHFEKDIFFDGPIKLFTNSSGSILCIFSYGWYYCKNPSNIFRQLNTMMLPEPFVLPDTLAWYASGKIHVRMGFAGIVDVIIDNNKKVNVPFIDKAGNLWYSEYLEKATGFQGLKKVTFVKNNFKNIFFRDFITEAPTVYSICKTGFEDIVVASNSAGLIKWNSKTVKLNEIFRNTQSTFPEGILMDHQQNLWVSYNDARLVRYNDKLDQPVEILPRFAKKLGIDFILSFKVLTIDHQDNMIIGGSKGIAIFNPVNLSKIYSISFSDLNQVRSVCVNDKNDLVIGTQNNLIFLDRRTNSTREFRLPGQNNYWIESICQYNDSVYWLGLLGGGICKWNKYKNTFHVYTTKDGLCNNSVYCILKDDKGNLWISTNEGISSFNPVSGLFINYGVNEGLQVTEFNSGACFQASDGEMFFGGIEGVVRFYPDSIRKSENNPLSNLMITDFRVSGISRFFDEAVYESPEIHLDPGTDNFQLGFSLLEFTKPEQVKYRYQLETYNKNWIYTDHKHRFVNYINLDPGRYRFIVEATDNMGYWSKSKILTIIIPAKYYQTLWFKAFIALICLLLIIFIIYSRYHVLILKEKRNKDQLSLALKESKLEILRKQLNPHFIYNSLNSINYYISLSDKIKANQFITDFARLMRNILDNSSQEMIDFDKETETLEDYLMLEKIRFNNRFEYDIQSDGTISRMATQVMPSMVQPFAENAIIHGLSNLKSRIGKLSIRFSREDDNYLTCTIEDNGIGRKKSEGIRGKDQKKRKTRGMEIIAERLSIFNAINGTHLKLMVEDIDPDQEETGTRVIIQIPAKQNI